MTARNGNGALCGITVLVLMLGLLLTACQKQDGQTITGDTQDIIDTLAHRLDIVERRLAQDSWHKAVDGESDSLAFFNGLRRDLLTNEGTFSALRGGRNRLSDDLVRRRYDLVYARMLEARLCYGHGLAGLYDSLVDYHNSSWCRFDEQVREAADLHRMIATSDRRIDRELAFRALNTPDSRVVDQTGRLLRLRNQTAKRMGYNDCFSLLMSAANLRSDDYRRMIDDIDAVTRPAWDSLKNSIQAKLQSNVGQLEVWDWEHDFRGPVREINQYFPVDSQLIILKRSMAGLGFQLDALPIYLLADTSLPATSSTVLIVDVPQDVRVVCRLTDGVAGMSRLLGYIGQALYVVSVAQEEPAFKRLLSPEMKEGIRLYFAQLVRNKEWLTTYAGVPSDVAGRYLKAANADEQYRLRMLLVGAAFEREAYDNPNQDLGMLYWRLFDSYTGLPRHDDLSPWASNVQIVAEPLGSYVALAGAVIAAQTEGSLTRQYGGPVNNSDIRAFLLQNYFRFGSRYQWRELLERGTGEEFSPRYLTAGR